MLYKAKYLSAINTTS